MALTLGTQKKFSEGARWKTVTPITVDTSYPTGGWALTPTQLGLPMGLVDEVYVTYNGKTAAGGVTFVYDTANQKLMAFGGAASGAVQAEITNATNLSGDFTNLQVVAVGQG